MAKAKRVHSTPPTNTSVVPRCVTSTTIRVTAEGSSGSRPLTFKADSRCCIVTAAVFCHRVATSLSDESRSVD